MKNSGSAERKRPQVDSIQIEPSRACRVNRFWGKDQTFSNRDVAPGASSPNIYLWAFACQTSFCQVFQYQYSNIIIPISLFQYQYSNIRIPISVFQYKYCNISIPIPIFQYQYSNINIPIFIFQNNYFNISIPISEF